MEEPSITVRVSVDTSELDEAIQKLQLLLDLQEKANS